MPELILHNARIYTQSPATPWAEAVAVNHGRVLAVGSDRDIQALVTDKTVVLDLQQNLVLPGLTDSHIHFHDMAWRRNQLVLYNASSLDDALARIKDYASALPPDAWILGYGWAESAWAVPEFPDRHDLDSVTGDRPALLWRTDLHAAWANSAALAHAGIDASTRNPISGVIDKDDQGQPTGILRELAINLVRSTIPPMGTAAATTNLLNTAADLLALGIVAVQDQRMKDHSEEGPQALRLYQRLAAEGRLPLRVSCNIEAAHLNTYIELGLLSGFGNEWLRIGHVKLFSDGSLGARTAWMLDAYEGEDANTGMYLTAPGEMLDVIQRAHRHGYAISIHAIGDRANREVLDIFDEVIAAGTDAPPLIPHRIEHVQTIQPQDLPRLAELAITASVQPIHCADDIVNADRLWGERGGNTYAFRDLLNHGTNVAFGSDAPVANPNPWLGIYTAVTRQRADGYPQGGWYPEQALTVAEAIHAYTLGAATAIGQAHEQGRIQPGYLADFVVVDRDIFGRDPAQIAETKVIKTILSGKIVYDAGV